MANPKNGPTGKKTALAVTSGNGPGLAAGSGELPGGQAGVEGVSRETPWPADRVERRSTAALVPYARNPRTHSESQIAQVAASIRQWGWTMPVLVDEADEIIAGHGRVLAAQRLGLPEVPVIVARGWSEGQKRAYVIADNKLGLNAGWDDALLTLELGDLKSVGFDLGLTGFEPGEVEELFARQAIKAGLTDEDAAPELPAEPATRAGDVWLLGKHRLVCGDACDAAVVERCLAGAKPHLMVTDPPYGVDYDPNWRNDAEQAGYTSMKHKANAGALGVVTNDDRADWRAAWSLFPGDVAYVWHAGLRGGEVAAGLAVAGFEMRNQIVWAKNQIAISRGQYHWQHEPCWYAVRKGATGHWSGDRKQSTLWQIDKPQKSETGHSTQKPVECMRRPMENNSRAGQAVYEPFCGSGTTIIAGEQTGRTVLAIELEPAYVDMAVLRWQNFSGGEATLEGDGRSFVAIRAERLGADDGQARTEADPDGAGAPAR